MIAMQRWLEHGTMGRELLKSRDLDLAAFQQSSHAVNLLSVPQCLHLESRITRLHPGFAEPSSELEYLVTHVADKLLAKRSRMPQLFSRVQFMLNESGKQANWQLGVGPIGTQVCGRCPLPQASKIAPEPHSTSHPTRVLTIRLFAWSPLIR